jgi:hypothetical protein
MNKEKLFAKLNPKEIMLMSLIALGGMLIFTSAMGVYLTFFSEFSTTFRVLAGINTFFGALFLFSNLVSTYQSYQMIKLADIGSNILDMFNYKNPQDLTNPDEIKESNELKGGDE